VIIDMPHTTAGAVCDRLVRLRDEGGVVSLGRVLTLVIETAADDVERAIRAANEASREHPCRVVVVDRSSAQPADDLAAQIRIGGDAGASEVVVLRPSGVVRDETDTLVIPFLLPDAPVVAWWSSSVPESPHEDPIGARAERRITDAVKCPDPLAALDRLRLAYAPGDTDLSWTRVTTWRAIVASSLDEPPYEPVLSVEVTGNATRPAPYLLAAWVAEGLGCPATVLDEGSHRSLTGIRLERRSGPVVVHRADGASVATLDQPGHPRQRIVMPPRSRAELLAEELRRLDPDRTYGRTLTHGLQEVRTA
jgi:glucose-6-phosphate dehydrogenase assembly protein OpcA